MKRYGADAKPTMERISVVVKKVVAIFYKFYTQYFKRICFMADTIFGIA